MKNPNNPLKNAFGYIKCGIQNRYTLIGYTLLTWGGSNIIKNIIKEASDPQLANESQLPLGVLGLFAGGIILALTKAGYHSYEHYQKMKKHFLENKEIEPRFKEKLGNMYCCKAGYLVALKELGQKKNLEKLLGYKKVSMLDI